MIEYGLCDITYREGISQAITPFDLYEPDIIELYIFEKELHLVPIQRLRCLNRMNIFSRAPRPNKVVKKRQLSYMVDFQLK